MRALTFFQDGDLPELNPEIQKSLREAVSRIDLEMLQPMPRIGGKLEGEEEA